MRKDENWHQWGFSGGGGVAQPCPPADSDMEIVINDGAVWQQCSRAKPEGLPGGSGSRATHREAGGAEKAFRRQKVLLSWSRGCAGAVDGGEARKRHKAS